MNKNIIKQLGNPFGWLYVILVVALLYIVSNNSSKIADLEEERDYVIQTAQQDRKALANEIKVRESELEMLDTMLNRLKAEAEANYNAYVEMKTLSEKQVDVLGEAGAELSDLRQELSDTKTLLEVCTATPKE